MTTQPNESEFSQPLQLSRLQRAGIALALLLLVTGCSQKLEQTDYEAIAQQYCDATMAKDIDALTTLFWAPVQKAINKEIFDFVEPSVCEVLEVKPPYATIRFKYAIDDMEDEKVASLYMLSDGKLKYDVFHQMHPAPGLRGLLFGLQDPDIEGRKGHVYTLERWGVPLFGYQYTASPESQRKAIDKIEKWIEENEASYDAGKPKIPLSPEDLKHLREVYIPHWESLDPEEHFRRFSPPRAEPVEPIELPGPAPHPPEALPPTLPSLQNSAEHPFSMPE